MSGSNLVRLSFSIEEELNDKFETLIREQGYENRSEYIRDMIRKQLTRRHCAAGGDVIGTVSYLYDPEKPGLLLKLLKLRKESPVQILGDARSLLKEGLCSEMVMVRGKGSDIRALAESIRKQTGVLQTEFVITSPGS
jgi:CopG family nickel-responsive transcriptional regulator